MRSRIAVTLAALSISACATPRSYVVLLPDPDGTAGVVELRGEKGSREIREPRTATSFDVDRKAEELAPDEIRDRFGTALDAAPLEPETFVVYFRSDSAALQKEARAIVAKAVEAAKLRGVPEITVIGRADRYGPDAYNDRLALARAKRVHRELLRRNVPADRLDVIVLGERKPVVVTKDEVREPLNRRVDVMIR